MSETIYSQEQIESWQTQLEAIAELPRTSFTKKQVVEELMEGIEKALTTRNYQEVADTLREDGLDISAGSLKQYVSRYRSANRAPKSKRKLLSTDRKEEALSEGKSQPPRQKKASTRRTSKTR